jgi:hypothetical protein
LKKRSDLSELTKKITHKSVGSSIEKFEQADQALGTNEKEKLRERVVRKSYALTKQDLENINIIKDKCLNQKVVLNDSHVIRMAIGLTVKLTEDSLIKASSQTPRVITGRPKGS